MQHYVPPKNAFAPAELAILRQALESAWAEIRARNLLEIEKDEALKRAVCLKMLSLTRSTPTDPNLICVNLLLSLETDSDPRRDTVR